MLFGHSVMTKKVLTYPTKLCCIALQFGMKPVYIYIKIHIALQNKEVNEAA